MIEAGSRIIINKLLKEFDWILPGDDGVINVEVEIKNEAGFADYVLKDSSDFPLCIISKKIIDITSCRYRHGVTRIT